MAEKYSLKEIIKFAVEIEKEGILFYDGMFKKTDIEKNKKIFAKLRDDEKIHQKKFENILDALGEDENKFLYHEENEYIAYLHGFIEKSVFNKENTKSILADIKTDKEVIDYALGKEEDSIKFYENMKKITSFKNAPIIDIIISEENLHIAQLLEIKNTL